MEKNDDGAAVRAIDELVEKVKPDDAGKVDAQFARKIAALEKEGRAPKSMLEQLRKMWAMLKAPDDVVSFRSKTLIMAAVTYFVSPLDMVPDLIGFAGHIDDAIVVRIVYGRLTDDLAAYEAWKK